jgi:hypothetical protein
MIDGGEHAVATPAAFLWASADGQTFAFRKGAGGEPHSCATLVVGGEKAKLTVAWVSPSLMYPAPDGRLIYSSRAIYNSDLKELFTPKRDAGDRTPRATVPAHHGPYCVEVASGKLACFVAGQNQTPFARFDAQEVVPGDFGGYGDLPGPLDASKRVHLISDAKLLVTNPKSGDRLVLRRFDAEAELEKSGLNYLVVTSRPVEEVTPGKEYSYQIAARAKQGKPPFRVETGPKGLGESNDGLVKWTPPAVVLPPTARSGAASLQQGACLARPGGASHAAHRSRSGP